MENFGEFKKVLDGQGFVELVDNFGSDASAVRAARVSYNGDKGVRPEEHDKKLIRYLVRNNHTSPFEHVAFTFHVKAPMFVARQWMRHRTWSFNEVSARYTTVEESFYQPLQWRGQSSDNKQMSEGVIDDFDVDVAYADAVSNALNSYAVMLDAGVSREMARMVLPQSMFTRFYATIDLHNLLNFIRLRDHDHAQPEIREYAVAMKELASSHAPWTIEAWDEMQSEK